jgi:hypothetical protein
MTIKEARQRLAKAGIGLGTVHRRGSEAGLETIYPIITPVGSTIEFQADDFARLLRDLARASNA